MPIFLQSDVQAEVDQLCLELNGCRSSSSEDCEDNDTASSVSDVSFLNSIAIAQERYPNSSGSLRERNHRNSGTSMLEVESVNECHSVTSTETKKVNCVGFSACCYVRCVIPYISYFLCTLCYVTMTSLC